MLCSDAIPEYAEALRKLTTAQVGITEAQFASR